MRGHLLRTVACGTTSCVGDVDGVVGALIDARTRGSERFICLARVAFCVVMLARRASFGGLWDGERIPTSAFVVVPVLAGIIAFSAWLARRCRRPRLPRAWLHLSVAVDAAGCFVALGANALFPTNSYHGIAAHPDVIALPLVIAIAGFRMSTSAAVVGAVLNVASFLGLVVVDEAFAADRLVPKPGAFFLIGICLAGTSAVAVAVARRARSMAFDAADAAVTADRARTGLGAILEEHHDLKSTLGAALLSAELVQREIEERGALDDDAKRRAADLTRELNVAASTIRELRGRVLGEAAALDRPTPCDVRAAVAAAVGVVRAKYPAVVVEVRAHDDAARALVRGGGASLERIALNLVLNACEGDGVRAAKRVVIGVAVGVGAGDAPVVELHVHDDGPGLGDKPARGGSRKADGSGLGLVIVQRLVTASGGTLTLASGGELGGAHACVKLPRASF